MRNANKEDSTLRDAAESISNDLESKIFKRFSASEEGSELNQKKKNPALHNYTNRITLL